MRKLLCGTAKIAILERMNICTFFTHCKEGEGGVRRIKKNIDWSGEKFLKIFTFWSFIPLRISFAFVVMMSEL